MGWREGGFLLEGDERWTWQGTNAKNTSFYFISLEEMREKGISFSERMEKNFFNRVKDKAELREKRTYNPGPPI